MLGAGLGGLGLGAGLEGALVGVLGGVLGGGGVLLGLSGALVLGSVLGRSGGGVVLGGGRAGSRGEPGWEPGWEPGEAEVPVKQETTQQLPPRVVVHDRALEYGQTLMVGSWQQGTCHLRTRANASGHHRGIPTQ